jgi:hypothetical protein
MLTVDINVILPERKETSKKETQRMSGRLTLNRGHRFQTHSMESGKRKLVLLCGSSAPYLGRVILAA